MSSPYTPKLDGTHKHNANLYRFNIENFHVEQRKCLC